MHDLYERLRRAGTALATVRDEKGRLGWSLFQNPFRILTARAVGEVEPVFRELEAALRNGAFAAGFVAYEAAPAFDPELKTFPPDGFPLIRFALYREKPRRVRIPDDDGAPPRLSLEPEIEKRIYCERFADVKRNIEAGEIYQANLTFRCKGAAPQDPERLFLNLLARHPVPCAAFLHFEDMRILSLSPELFLESDGRRIVSRPMKGTAKRRPLLREDRAAARRLARDPKNRAENLMITDMVRNDLSKICPPGGVATKQLFHVETYRTVHQMVSEVRGGLRPGVGLFDVFRATFPPASITGAPKIRATQILFDDESNPRRVYTGAIGCFLPGGAFRLNVAIRTLLCRAEGAETGVGGGIVHDSTAEFEWREALLKSQWTTCGPEAFRLVETIPWTRDGGFADLAAHLRRMKESQLRFGRPFRMTELACELERTRHALSCDRACSEQGACVRILLDRRGKAEIQTGAPRAKWEGRFLKILISRDRIDSGNELARHKTDRRGFFDERLNDARAHGFDEVVFRNERGELAEGSISNLLLRKEGIWKTPPLSCGLLPGIQREKALRELHALECVLTLDDLRNADEVRIGNSVRGSGRVVSAVLEETGEELRGAAVRDEGA